MNRNQLLSALKSLINYHAVCGIEQYPVADDVLEQLVGMERRKADERNALPRLEKVRSASIGKVKSVPLPSGGTVFSGDMRALKERVKACCRCSLCQSRHFSSAGKGGERPVLLIIGDWLAVDNSCGQEAIFGRDQDAMLSKMISAIQLAEKDVYITNAVKCTVPEHKQPTKEHIESCAFYLYSQIEMLVPKVICTMGIIPTRLLIGRTQPLSRQRGRFFPFRTQSGLEIPLMPTYHPTFLLRNGEMKKETWKDLQAIQEVIGQN